MRCVACESVASITTNSVEKGGESTNFDKAVLGSQVEPALIQGHS